MLQANGKVYRNLQEQVQKNQDDITQLKRQETIAELGIRVLNAENPLASTDELPSANTFDGEYGDAYIVGEHTPYRLYVWSKSNDPGLNGFWFDWGELNAPSTVPGVPGPQGPQGETGQRGSKWTSLAEGDLLPNIANALDGDQCLYTNTGNVYEARNGQWVLIGSIRGPQGIQGIQGEVGPKGEQGDQGIQGVPGQDGQSLRIIAILDSVDKLPAAGTVPQTYAYLVGTDVPYAMYAQVGDDNADLVWTNIGGFEGVKGDTGETGAQGPQGEQGAQGVPGPQGVGIESINTITYNDEGDYTVTTVESVLTDNQNQQFTVFAKNGKDGKDGTNGTDGVSPTVAPLYQATFELKISSSSFMFTITSLNKYELNKAYSAAQLANELGDGNAVPLTGGSGAVSGSPSVATVGKSLTINIPDNGAAPTFVPTVIGLYVEGGSQSNRPYTGSAVVQSSEALDKTSNPKYRINCLLNETISFSFIANAAMAKGTTIDASWIDPYVLPASGAINNAYGSASTTERLGIVQSITSRYWSTENDDGYDWMVDIRWANISQKALTPTMDVTATATCVGIREIGSTYLKAGTGLILNDKELDDLVIDNLVIGASDYAVGSETKATANGDTLSFTNLEVTGKNAAGENITLNGNIELPITNNGTVQARVQGNSINFNVSDAYTQDIANLMLEVAEGAATGTAKALTESKEYTDAQIAAVKEVTDGLQTIKLVYFSSGLSPSSLTSEQLALIKDNPRVIIEVTSTVDNTVTIFTRAQDTLSGATTTMYTFSSASGDATISVDPSTGACYYSQTKPALYRHNITVSVSNIANTGADGGTATVYAMFSFTNYDSTKYTTISQIMTALGSSTVAGLLSVRDMGATGYGNVIPADTTDTISIIVTNITLRNGKVGTTTYFEVDFMAAKLNGSGDIGTVTVRPGNTAFVDSVWKLP